MRVDSEFVVASADVLHQGMTADDHALRVVAFESAHGSESGFESAVVAFDSVVRVPGGVVKRGGYEAFDRSPQRWGPIRDDCDGLAVHTQCSCEEPACGPGIASGGDQTSMIWPC